ncbi:MAG: adenylate kinase [Chitinophagales bacterium]|nr:adenylate kinase [Bacteroidota bacterium]MCB9226662.1 adenylate kinase [Chitinophagales bacterium]
MINLVLFGPPGSGKGTQSEKLEEKYNLLHISTGDLFRAHMKNETPLGKKAKAYIEKGDLVPDEVTIGMMNDKIEKHPEVNGFIFDGFPRTAIQAEALDKFLNEKNIPISKMIALEVEEEELVKRLLNRGKDSGRADDQNVSIIKNRIEVYNEKTLPVADYYRKQNKYEAVNGIGSIENIFDRLCAVIDVLA